MKFFKGIIQYFKNWKQFKKMGGKFKLLDIYPRPWDRYLQAGNIPTHYFYQDLWAAQRIAESKVKRHFDLGSRLDGFITHVASFIKVVMIDVRPLDKEIPNVSFIQSNFIELSEYISPYSIQSISALHSIEHVGLGRYGDPVGPNLWKKAIKEMKKITKIGGDIYFSVPIGRERVCFDAYRVFDPKTIINEFKDCKFIEFSVVDDNKNFLRNVCIEEYRNQRYACGLFHFKKL